VRLSRRSGPRIGAGRGPPPPAVLARPPEPSTTPGLRGWSVPGRGHRPRSRPPQGADTSGRAVGPSLRRSSPRRASGCSTAEGRPLPRQSHGGPAPRRTAARSRPDHGHPGKGRSHPRSATGLGPPPCKTGTRGPARRPAEGSVVQLSNRLAGRFDWKAPASGSWRTNHAGFLSSDRQAASCGQPVASGSRPAAASSARTWPTRSAGARANRKQRTPPGARVGCVGARGWLEGRVVVVGQHQVARLHRRHPPAARPRRRTGHRPTGRRRCRRGRRGPGSVESCKGGGGRGRRWWTRSAGSTWWWAW
jgi:hypothetical protein